MPSVFDDDIQKPRSVFDDDYSASNPERNILDDGPEIIDVRDEARQSVKNQMAAAKAGLQDEADDKGLARIGALASPFERYQQFPGKLAYSALDVASKLPGSIIANKARELIAPDFVNEAADEFLSRPQEWQKYYNERSQKLAKEDAALGVDDTFGRLTGGVVQAGLELPFQLVGGAGNLAKDAAIRGVAAGQGVLSGLSKYGEERGSGASPIQSLGQGAMSGLITGLTTRAFGDTGVESIFRSGGPKAVAQKLVNAIKQGTYQGSEEALQNLEQDLADRITKNPNKPIMESVEETLLSFGIGKIIGTGVAAAHTAGNSNPIQEFDESTQIAETPAAAQVVEAQPDLGLPTKTVEAVDQGTIPAVKEVAQGQGEVLLDKPDVEGGKEGGVKAVSEKTAALISKIRSGGKFNNNSEAIKAGLDAESVADLDALIAARRELQTTIKKSRIAEAKALATGDAAAARDAANQKLNATVTNSFLREAIESATDTGSHRVELRQFDSAALPLPKLPWHKNPEVEAWLRKNGEEVGIELPARPQETTASKPNEKTTSDQVIPAAEASPGLLQGARNGEDGQAGGSVKENLGADETNPTGLSEAKPTPVPEVESVTPLDPASGTPVSDPKLAGPGGAAVLGEVEPQGTGLKNVIGKLERIGHGFAEANPTQKREMAESWQAAEEQTASDPQAGSKLLDELLKNPNRGMSDEDSALLLRHKTELINVKNQAAEDSHRATNPEERQDAQMRFEAASSRLLDLLNAAKERGTSWGREGRWRQALAFDDFSLETMRRDKQASLDRELTPSETEEIKTLHDQIADLEKKLAEARAGQDQKGRESGVNEATSEAVSRAKQSRKKDADTGVVRDLEQERDDAIQNLKERFVEQGDMSGGEMTVQKLMEILAMSGIEERVAMEQAVHRILRNQVDPSITLQTTQDLMSGYGKTTSLSKDPIKAIVRGIRGEIQQVRKLLDFWQGQPAKKTGPERRTPTDKEREWIKLVNKAKKAFNIPSPNPEAQLKSAIDTANTRLKNRLTDLKQEVATREKIVRERTPSPYNEETLRLKQEIAEVEKLHKEIFGNPKLSPEQRLKLAKDAAERQIKELERQLATGEVFSRRQTKDAPTDDQLNALRSRIEELKYERDNIRETIQPSPEVVAREQERLLNSLDTQIENLTKKIEDGRVFPKPRKVLGEEVELVIAKRKELSDLKERRKWLRDSLQPSPEIEQREQERRGKSLDKQIEAIEKQIANQEVFSKGKTPKPEDSEANQKKAATLAELKQQRDFMRETIQPKMEPEARTLLNILQRYSKLERQYAERLAKKDFAKKERKPQPVSEDTARAKARLDEAKERFRDGLEKDRYDRKNVFQKSATQAGNAWDTAKLLMAGGELSFILRQGKAGLVSRPVEWAKAIPPSIKALLSSPEGAATLNNQILERADAKEAQGHGLYLSKTGSRPSAREEIAWGRMAEKIPGVRHFNQAGLVFLNKLRLDHYNALAKSLSKTGTPTAEEAQKIAETVNIFSGRGGLGAAARIPTIMNRTFFSPRYLTSRFQMAGGYPIWGSGHTARSRKLIAKEYARMLIGYGVYYSLLIGGLKGLMGDKEDKVSVGSDTNSTDFGKIKVGNTTIDPLAGLGQATTFLSRSVTGEKTTNTGKKVDIRTDSPKFGGEQWSDLALRFGRTKLNPVPANFIDWMNGTDLMGKKVSATKTAAEFVMPMTYGDIYDAMKEQDIPTGTAISLLGFLGEGISTYQKNEKK